MKILRKILFIISLVILAQYLQTFALLAVNCAECCKQGRSASAECLRNCNQCELYDDEAKAEGKDFPY